MLYAAIFINLAFILYTIGVWSEKVQGELKLWHVIIFWLGVINDSMGTLAMEDIVRKTTSGVDPSVINGLQLHLSFHSITGMLALALMLFHVVWATMVLVQKDTMMVKKFHQLSLFVWIVWLIPFITGALAHVV